MLLGRLGVGRVCSSRAIELLLLIRLCIINSNVKQYQFHHVSSVMTFLITPTSDFKFYQYCFQN